MSEKTGIDHPTFRMQMPSTQQATESSEVSNILGMMEKLLHWAAIIESSDDAIISKSMDGFITSWNAGAEKLYGYKPEEIIGKPVSVLMPPDKESDFPHIMKQLREGRKISHYETRRKTKDGRIIDVAITVSPVKDSHGNLIGASKIARDITEQKEQQKRREDFISAASHELKTPITTQKVYQDLLKELIEKNGHIQYQPYIEKIIRQTGKLEKLVQDLLQVSRGYIAQLRLNFETFYLNDVVQQVAGDLQQTTPHKITLTNNSKNPVVADADRIGQVLTNLLSNAIKYSSEEKEIVIDTQDVGDTVVVAVRDFGIGINKEHQQKIFEKFYRVNGGTYPGMGVGLALCKEIIDRHHGELWVQSDPGSGSTFYFSLPVVQK